ncbi:hypothetical protein B9W68_30395 [Streptomyces sp. CS227]|uniref:transposase family protein n=1 Tax=Streptomyces sp. CS227 TaxID=1982763 RepID=UPI000B40A382|nr:transposase family protein [Streptomyces sp. CS227]OWA01576.1 hypothetical protein B9W68_30395 [Streptomyces sp. CS227]
MVSTDRGVADSSASWKRHRSDWRGWFPAIVDLAVLSVDVSNDAVHVEARSTAAETVCPGCGSHSSRMHSSYLRFPADVPSAGRRVVLCLWVRRFFCCCVRTADVSCPEFRRVRWSWFRRTAGPAPGFAGRLPRTRRAERSRARSEGVLRCTR